MAEFHEYPKSMHHRKSGDHQIVQSEAEELALGSDFISGHDYWRGVAEGQAVAEEPQAQAVPTEHMAPEKPAKPAKTVAKPKAAKPKAKAKAKEPPTETPEPVEGQQ